MIESMPVLTIQMSEVKRTILAHLNTHVVEINAIFADQVEKFCTPENITRIIQEAVKEVVPAAITSSVKSYFSYGDGKAMIDETVHTAVRGLSGQGKSRSRKQFCIDAMTTLERPVSAKELTERFQAAGWVITNPINFRCSLLVMFKRRQDIFVKTGKGLYYLKEPK